MLINIRDDDTNYFTTPSELIEAYGNYLFEIPITIACTPFVSQHSFIMDTLVGDRNEQFEQLKQIEMAMGVNELADMNRLYPLGDNVELTDFLQSLIDKGKIEIALHGFSHRFYDNGAEFIKDHVSYYNVRDGKLYFERLFNTEINLFVPPSNKINVTALHFLKSLNMKLLTSGIVDCDTIFQKLYLYGQLAFTQPKSIKGLAQGKLAINPAIIGGVPYYRSRTFTLDDNCESYLNRNRRQIESDGFVSIATHYTALSKDKVHRERFFELLECLKNEYPDCKFVTAKELMERLVL